MKHKPSSVGSRELKTRLGAYLKRVRGGETIVVTDRGEPVAELRPIAAAEGGMAERLQKMAAQGLLTLPIHGNGLSPFKPVRLRGGMTASEAVSADRDERENALLGIAARDDGL